MYAREKPLREEKSFSSVLLDEIYRSIAEGDENDSKFYRQSTTSTMAPKGQSTWTKSVVHNRAIVEPEKCHSTKAIHESRRKDKTRDLEKKSRQQRDRVRDFEQDVMFFSSTSSGSSDSSSGGFSSDTESFYNARPGVPSLASLRPKLVRIGKAETEQKTERVLFLERNGLHMFDNYYHSSSTEQTPSLENGVIKSKSRALKIYTNLKKVKQPISPGGKLASFINSLLTNKKPSKNAKNTCAQGVRNATYPSSTTTTTCSSASSFSRSCLVKNSPSTREKWHNGIKRTVHFDPISVIVDEGFRANDFLKNYERNQKRNELITKGFHDTHVYNYDEDEDDDSGSCSSSDLFELDHLKVKADYSSNLCSINHNRYCEELPVYETTHVRTNLSIAKGLLV